MELSMEESLSTHGMQIFVFRPHLWKIWGPASVQGATPHIGGHGGARVPKQLRKLKIDINRELFLTWWGDIITVWQFGMVMV
jgi:hypothetical protein